MALDDWGDDSHEGQLLKFIKGWMAKGERSKIAERMQRGKRQRAREGKIVPAGRPPLGYEYVGDTYWIDESNMVLVRRVFSLAAGGMSLWRIKKTFESEGILTPGSTYKGPSRYWNVNTIRRIIKRDEYLAHSPEDIQGLVAAEQLTASVAANLEPHKSYGISWYNRYHTSGTANKRRKGEERPHSEWIAVPVPDAGILREQVEKARANLRGKGHHERIIASGNYRATSSVNAALNSWPASPVRTGTVTLTTFAPGTCGTGASTVSGCVRIN